MRPGFKARSTPCSRVPLPSLFSLSLSHFFSLLCSLSLHVPSPFFLPLSSPSFLLSFSISRCTSAISRPYTRTLTRVHHDRAQSITVILCALASHLAFSPSLPLSQQRRVGLGDSSSVGDKRPIKGTVETSTGG